MAIATAKVVNRRKLNYSSLADILLDAEQLCSASRKVLGNWTEGQIFGHLALAYNGSIDGFAFTFPWYMRLMGRAFRNKLLSGPMPAGYDLPGGGTKALAPPPASIEQGLAQLRDAIARLEREPLRARHPMLGQLTVHQWNQVHLAHANLHMSFIVPT